MTAVKDAAHEVLLGIEVKPASGIENWAAWPDDVRALLMEWNSGRPEARLSFYRRGLFDCADCCERCEPARNGVACIKTHGREWLCDDCLIGRARAMLPLREAYGQHRREGRLLTGCVCVTPSRIAAAGGAMPTILPGCEYHEVAAAYPNDHAIPWNCPSYYDGCNCTRPNDRPALPRIRLDEVWRGGGTMRHRSS